MLLLLSRYTGFWATLGLVLGTGVFGAWLARRQWRWLLQRTQSRIQQQELPQELVTDGLMILMGACLLVTPGILTDLLGLTLMVPVVRSWLRKVAGEWIRGHVVVLAPPPGNPPGPPDVVDGKARRTPTP